METREVIIVGSGPAGLTAAVYTARANLHPLVIEGIGAGGQLMLTTDVENYPGFPDGILGPELMAQVPRAGRALRRRVRDRRRRPRRPLRRTRYGSGSAARSTRARSIIISTGAQARMLGLPVRAAACSVTACRRARRATASSSAASEIAVVGGGDSALEEATFLTRFADKVTVVHRRKELRASKIMQDRAFANPKIEFRWNSVVEARLGDGRVEGLRAARHRDRRNRASSR